MNEEKKAFLAVGAGAYAPGLGALGRFRQEIYNGSKRSMTRNLGRLDRRETHTARFYLLEDRFTTLAAKLTVQGRTHIYASMMWRQATDDETPVVVAVEFEPWYAPWKRKILRVARELYGGAVVVENQGIWLQEEVSPGNIWEFELLLDGVFARWIGIFEMAGGFPTDRAE